MHMGNIQSDISLFFLNCLIYFIFSTNQPNNDDCRESACCVCHFQEVSPRQKADTLVLNVKCSTKLNCALLALAGLVWLVCSIFPLSLKKTNKHKTINT